MKLFSTLTFKLLIILSLASFSLSLFAAKDMMLNGTGVRKKFFMEVYKADLYLEKPSKDASEVLSSPLDKRIVMTFLRDVDQAKIADAWKEGFEKNTPAQELSLIKPQVDAILAGVTEMKKHEVLSIYFYGNQKCELTNRNQQKTSLDSKDFCKALLAIWLGSNPPTQDLKKGMLGSK